MAVADLLGRAAGDIVKSVSKEDAVRTWLCECGTEGFIELIA
jgi:hypothetical protein